MFVVSCACIANVWQFVCTPCAKQTPNVLLRTTDSESKRFTPQFQSMSTNVLHTSHCLPLAIPRSSSWRPACALGCRMVCGLPKAPPSLERTLGRSYQTGLSSISMHVLVEGSPILKAAPPASLASGPWQTIEPSTWGRWSSMLRPTAILGMLLQHCCK